MDKIMLKDITTKEGRTRAIKYLIDTSINPFAIHDYKQAIKKGCTVKAFHKIGIGYIEVPNYLIN